MEYTHSTALPLALSLSLFSLLSLLCNGQSISDLTTIPFAMLHIMPFGCILDVIVCSCSLCSFLVERKKKHHFGHNIAVIFAFVSCLFHLSLSLSLFLTFPHGSAVYVCALFVGCLFVCVYSIGLDASTTIPRKALVNARYPC